MSDLRSAVEALPSSMRYDGVGPRVILSDVLALIPEGAVLVTEETVEAFELAAIDAHAGWMLFESERGETKHAKEWTDCVVPVCVERAAIMRHLREGT